MVTTSGRPGVVFNGVADWVYEEEVLSDTKAIYFSPDGDKLAWIEFNDTDVDVMTITHYGQPGNLQFQYPIQTPLRYNTVQYSTEQYSITPTQVPEARQEESDRQRVRGRRAWSERPAESQTPGKLSGRRRS